MANREIFKGLGSGLMDQERFGQVITNKCIETSLVPDDVICPAFYTGYHGYEDSYACVHNALGVNCGEGKIYLTTLDMENTLGIEPAAERLLMNFIAITCCVQRCSVWWPISLWAPDILLRIQCLSAFAVHWTPYIKCRRQEKSPENTGFSKLFRKRREPDLNRR